MKPSILNYINRIKSIADVGLLYTQNDYDKERYEELRQISFELLSNISNYGIEDLKESFLIEKEYPTAKVDVRGIILSEDKKVLLIKEGVDGKWSLPGGWADIGYSPAEVIIKEVREEAGLNIVPVKLLAVFDKKMHNHPPQTHYVYKLVFFCKVLSEEINKGFEVLDCRYFSINHLPELSEDRILKNRFNYFIIKLSRQILIPTLIE